MYFQNTVQAGDLQAIYYNFVCSFKKNFVIKRLICRCENYVVLVWLVCFYEVPWQKTEKQE